MKRFLILAPLLLTACAGDKVIGPSLAKRAAENGSMDAPVRTVTPPPDADARLRSRIGGLVEQARSSQRAFSEMLPRARQAASAGGPEGSETWIAGQQLLSALEATRAPSTQALGDLDALIAERIRTGDEAGLSELEAANAEVSALVAGQQDEIDAIRARLSR